MIRPEDYPPLNEVCLNTNELMELSKIDSNIRYIRRFHSDAVSVADTLHINPYDTVLKKAFSYNQIEEFNKNRRST